MPRHINPSTGWEATAPYNFVPLPERVLFAEELLEPDAPRPWQCHDRFLENTHSGWIALTIQALTPVFIRGPLTPGPGGEWGQNDTRIRPEPYTLADGRPAIPGSSLRGMIRSLVEILAFGKLQPVTEEKPFYRTVGTDRIGIAYRARMLQGNRKPDGGFLRERNGAWEIMPVEVRRIPHWVQDIGYRNNPAYTPDWKFQQRKCHVQLDNHGQVSGIRPSEDAPEAGWVSATLVLTGSAPKKKAEFVFLAPTVAAPVPIPTSVWRRFHDEDQLTWWQERAFPRDKPQGGDRDAHGHLCEGEPVFFLQDKSQATEENPVGLVFLGRAQMFRLPYDRSPASLLPDEHRDTRPDLAESLFGRVSEVRNASYRTIKGRVQFEDAGTEDASENWYEELLVPQILSSPKVSTFQHYLTQDGRRGKDELTTYVRGDQTTVRGHKIYWHRWDDRGVEAVRHPQEAAKRAELQRASTEGQSQGADTQCTLMRPVRAGTRFKGRIRFRNLTAVELGALLSALELPKGCAHRIGMARPLGLGSVQLHAELYLTDAQARYRSWSGSGEMPSPAVAEQAAAARAAFEEAIVNHARVHGEPLIPGEPGLCTVARLSALFTMLSWEGRPAPERTAYLPLEEFRNRKVLPTAHQVVGHTEPGWRQDPPLPAPKEELPDFERRSRERRRDGGPTPRQGDYRPDPTYRPAPTGIRPTPSPDRPVPPKTPPPAASDAALKIAALGVSTFANRTRGNLAQIIRDLEQVPAGPARARLARELVRKGEELRPPPSAVEQALLQSARAWTEVCG